MNNLKIVIPTIIVFILVVAGLFYLYQTQTSSKINLDSTLQTSPKNNFPQASSSATPSTVKGAQNQNSPQSQPSTGSESQQELKTIISITSPQEDNFISSPVKIQGFANVTSQTVIIRIKDANSHIIGSGKAPACIGYTPCEFSSTITFDTPKTQTGTIEAYSPSTFDNSIQDQTSQSINFK